MQATYEKAKSHQTTNLALQAFIRVFTTQYTRLIWLEAQSYSQAVAALQPAVQMMAKELDSLMHEEN